MAFADIVAASFLFAVGVVFYRPVLDWPADPHFAVFSMWALFGKEGEPIPRQLIRGNQGFSRIFLHHLMAAVCRFAGRKKLLAAGRMTQGAVISLNGCLLYLVARHGLGMGAIAAFLGAFLHVFVATRPRLDPVRINAEPYYALAASVSVWLLLAATRNEAPFPLLSGAVFLLSFVALNAKIVYLADAVALTAGYMLTVGSYSGPLAVASLALLAAVLLFVMMYWRYLTSGMFRNLLNYARWANQEAGRLTFRHLWFSILRPTPLPRLAVFGSIGAMMLWARDGNWILPCWLLSSILGIVAQRRLSNYHFQTVVAPLALASAAFFDAVLVPHPVVGGMAVCLLLVVTGARDMRAAVRLSAAGSVTEKLEIAFGDEYPRYYNIRLDDIVAHHACHPSPFIPWGVAPQLYALTGERPHTYAGAVTKLSHSVFPDQRTRLIEAVTSVEHPWIYDMSDNHPLHGSFNPLLFYRATGCLYSQRARRNNIGYFALVGRDDFRQPQGGGNLFLEETPELDLLDAEEKEAGRNGERPPLGRMDLLLLAGHWLNNSSVAVSRADRQWVAATADAPANRVVHLFATVVLGLAGDRPCAAERLAKWDRGDNPFLEISPTLLAVTWVVARLSGGNRGAWPLPVEILDNVQFHEACRLAPFLAEITKARQLATPEEREKMRATLHVARKADSPYDDKKSRGILADFLESWRAADQEAAGKALVTSDRGIS